MLRRAVFFSILGVASVTAAPEAFEGLRFHRPPKPLAQGAVTEDWPRFLGPIDQAVTKERPLLEKWPEGGLPVVWEMVCGAGYAAPGLCYEKGGALFDFDPEFRVTMKWENADFRMHWKSLANQSSTSLNPSMSARGRFCRSSWIGSKVRMIFW